ncbi:hypothetical protein [Microbulbifer magnicolonia]|uniref:hypothetical protein n=1 Tax=Microbulbifer magnicolonia TaxID=3109744 RepID=UPI002B4020B6|nr:hypothetical protein [Microbulbifer sp. GG15]
MSAEEKFQVVSAGKTLRAKAPEAVLQDAAKAFAIPLAQARRLLVKGWVIKDQLSSKQVLEYRTRLQQIGLRVEVFPAGKFDNRALIAKAQFAQQRRVRSQTAGLEAASTVSADMAVVEPSPPVEPQRAPPQSVEPRKAERQRADQQRADQQRAEPVATAATSSGKGGARAQVEALFSDELPAVRETAAERAGLLLGMLPAALVPGLFVLLLCLCGYTVARALWQIPQSILAGEFSALTATGSLISVSLAGFICALLLWPYFFVRRLAPARNGAIDLQQSDAKGLYLMLDVLAEKTGLPAVERIAVTVGVEVIAEPDLAEIRRQRLPLSIGLGAVRSLRGNELLALVARSLGVFRGKLGGLTAWLVLDTARRLQQILWALENERNVVSVSGDASALRKPWHVLFASCGRALIPLVERLDGCHKALCAPVARRLEKRGDAWAAQLLGSDAFVAFAEKWHQLVHADLVVGEINREASVAGQRLQDYPAAVLWMLCNLDDDTRSNIELAMAQASDPWDNNQAADNERIAWAEALALQPLLQREFSLQKLFENFTDLVNATSAAVAAEGARAVENHRLLTVSKEAERALQRLGEYFNQLPPRLFLPLELPAGEELQTMDLQEAVDWLRGKLVELRELEQRCDNLRARGVAMQLGSGLIRIQGSIQPQEYFLSGSTPAAADESVRDNRVRRQELAQQIRQIFSVFYLRIRRALAAMPAGERQLAEKTLEQLAAYEPLQTRLDRLENYAEILGMAIDRLSLESDQRELVQKYFALAAQELEAVFTAVDASEQLRGLGLHSALQERVDRSPVPKLPQKRQALIDVLQALELKCKYASAAIGEHYRIQLARLLESCLKQERAMDIRPLRLLKPV